MKKILLPVFALAGFISSCQKSGETKDIQQIQDSLLVIHDEVMPRNTEMLDLKDAISQQIDSLSKVKPGTPELKNRQEEGLAINKSLTEADSLMHHWMTHYNSDTLKALDETQARAYLDEEMKKINDIKEKINGGIDQAKKFLGN
ncbi:hypothetical protein ACO2Q8_16975 [Larkinella sp. VNQ87]|uniref:hypothetical protein n=1 Tax=Larkinella sp. VNQ87 TaxID=3400921 RepID=UPI003C10AF5D